MLHVRIVPVKTMLTHDNGLISAWTAINKIENCNRLNINLIIVSSLSFVGMNFFESCTFCRNYWLISSVTRHSHSNNLSFDIKAPETCVLVWTSGFRAVWLSLCFLLDQYEKHKKKVWKDKQSNLTTIIRSGQLTHKEIV